MSTASSFDFQAQDRGLAPPTPFYMQPAGQRSSLLSVDLVVGEKTDYNLQKVDPFFTDSNGEYYNAFSHKLSDLSGKNSVSDLCIEEYLVNSEKKWFDKYRAARLNAPISAAASTIVPSRPSSRLSDHSEKDEFLLGRDYKPPTGLKK